jgi:hypothetical protein
MGDSDKTHVLLMSSDGFNQQVSSQSEQSQAIRGQRQVFRK